MNDWERFLQSREYVTIPQLAALLGISRIAVYKKVKKGLIEASRIGRNYAIATDYIRKNIADIKTALLEEHELDSIDQTMKKAMSEYGEVFKALGKD